MKKKILIFLLLIFLVFPKNTFAHAIGQPPYFKIDGVFTDYYPVPSTSLNDFLLPQDVSRENFLIGQEISFEIDEGALPVPAEIVEKTKFLWDFGDGNKAEGLKNNHSYKNMGTYIVSIYASSDSGFEPQLLQNTAINIVPSKSYVLPKAIIYSNNKTVADPLLDLIEIDFSKEVILDGSKSKPGSSQIEEYFWDLGDRQSYSQVSVNHSYSDNPYAIFPLLRVKTKDGFFADAYVQLTDKNSTFSTQSQGKSLFDFLDLKILIVSAFISLALTFLIFVGFKKIFNAKRQ